MLETIRLKNFRSHHNTTIPLKNYTSIVGPNGSGKSNIIEALKFCLTTYSPKSRELLKMIYKNSLQTENVTHTIVRLVFTKRNSGGPLTESQLVDALPVENTRKLSEQPGQFSVENTHTSSQQLASFPIENAHRLSQQVNDNSLRSTQQIITTQQGLEQINESKIYTKRLKAVAHLDGFKLAIDFFDGNKEISEDEYLQYLKEEGLSASLIISQSMNFSLLLEKNILEHLCLTQKTSPQNLLTLINKQIKKLEIKLKSDQLNSFKEYLSANTVVNKLNETKEAILNEKKISRLAVLLKQVQELNVKENDIQRVLEKEEAILENKEKKLKLISKTSINFTESKIQELNLKRELIKREAAEIIHEIKKEEGEKYLNLFEEDIRCQIPGKKAPILFRMYFNQTVVSYETFERVKNEYLKLTESFQFSREKELQELETNILPLKTQLLKEYDIQNMRYSKLNSNNNLYLLKIKRIQTEIELLKEQHLKLTEDYLTKKQADTNGIEEEVHKNQLNEIIDFLKKCNFISSDFINDGTYKSMKALDDCMKGFEPSPISNYLETLKSVYTNKIFGRLFGLIKFNSFYLKTINSALNKYLDAIITDSQASSVFCLKYLKESVNENSNVIFLNLLHDPPVKTIKPIKTPTGDFLKPVIDLLTFKDDKFFGLVNSLLFNTYYLDDFNSLKHLSNEFIRKHKIKKVIGINGEVFNSFGLYTSHSFRPNAEIIEHFSNSYNQLRHEQKRFEDFDTKLMRIEERVCTLEEELIYYEDLVYNQGNFIESSGTNALGIVETRASQKENTRASLKENTRASLKENTRASLKENTRASLKENTLASLKENTRASLKENTRASLRENTLASLKENTRASLRENTLASLKENTRASLKQNIQSSVKTNLSDKTHTPITQPVLKKKNTELERQELILKMIKAQIENLNTDSIVELKNLKKEELKNHLNSFKEMNFSDYLSPKLDLLFKETPSYKIYFTKVSNLRNELNSINILMAEQESHKSSMKEEALPKSELLNQINKLIDITNKLKNKILGIRETKYDLLQKENITEEQLGKVVNQSSDTIKTSFNEMLIALKTEVESKEFLKDMKSVDEIQMILKNLIKEPQRQPLKKPKVSTESSDEQIEGIEGIILNLSKLSEIMLPQEMDLKMFKENFSSLLREENLELIDTDDPKCLFENLQNIQKQLRKTKRLSLIEKNKKIKEFLTALNDKSNEIYHNLKPDAIINLSINENYEKTNLEIKAKMEEEGFMKIENLSGGERDLIEWCLLFALSHILTKNYKQIIIIDELDKHLDNFNLKKLSEMLYVLSRKSDSNMMQVINVSHKPIVFSKSKCLIGCYSKKVVNTRDRESWNDFYREMRESFKSSETPTTTHVIRETKVISLELTDDVIV
ncbi:Chromosome partition protein Smc [Cucumispora dikerogammari]|nr:Chromosome partition protein Smc [Cucumispora dikerogammari]